MYITYIENIFIYAEIYTYNENDYTDILYIITYNMNRQ